MRRSRAPGTVSLVGVVLCLLTVPAATTTAESGEVGALLLAAAGPALAGSVMVYEGLLQEADGSLVAHATHGFDFTLFGVPEGGSPLWREIHQGVLVEDGRYAVSLGLVVPFDLPEGDYWLEITVDGEVMTSRELKQDIADLSGEEARDVVSGLRPVTFRYRSQPDHLEAGFIAEDVPDLVATADRKGLTSLDIVAVLTKVVQLQEERIDALQAEVSRLASTSP